MAKIRGGRLKQHSEWAVARRERERNVAAARGVPMSQWPPLGGNCPGIKYEPEEDTFVVCTYVLHHEPLEELLIRWGQRAKRWRRAALQLEAPEKRELFGACELEDCAQCPALEDGAVCTCECHAQRDWSVPKPGDWLIDVSAERSEAFIRENLREIVKEILEPAEGERVPVRDIVKYAREEEGVHTSVRQARWLLAGIGLSVYETRPISVMEHRMRDV